VRIFSVRDAFQARAIARPNHVQYFAGLSSSATKARASSYTRKELDIRRACPPPRHNVRRLKRFRGDGTRLAKPRQSLQLEKPSTQKYLTGRDDDLTVDDTIEQRATSAQMSAVLSPTVAASSPLPMTARRGSSPWAIVGRFMP